LYTFYKIDRSYFIICSYLSNFLVQPHFLRHRGGQKNTNVQKYLATLHARAGGGWYMLKRDKHGSKALTVSVTFSHCHTEGLLERNGDLLKALDN